MQEAVGLGQQVFSPLSFPLLPPRHGYILQKD